MNRRHRHILQKWRSVNWEGWWGDSTDVRFYLADVLGRLQGRRILDIGCGPGIGLSASTTDNQLVVGLEYDGDKLELAKKVCGWGRFICGDIYHLPFRQRSFDVIVLANIIEMVEDKQGFIRSLWCLLDEGGQILITTPNKEHWLYHSYNKVLQLEELQKLLKPYSKTRVMGYNPIPSPFSLLPVGLKKHLPASWIPFFFLPSGVLARVPGIDRLLTYLMGFEGLKRSSKFFFAVLEK